MRELLEHLETAGGSPAVALAYLAGQDIAVDEDELRGGLRRAELLLATGGDPRRELELDGRAVESLAADLDGPAARAELRAGLARLLDEAQGLPTTTNALSVLLADAELAWRCFACALLAEELTEEAED